MPEFKLVISDKETGKTVQIPVKDAKANALIGRKVNEVISGDLIGLAGYELKITGGSDRDGFPIRADVQGTARKAVFISSGSGIRDKEVRRRKYVRGNTISPDIVQINMVITKKGKRSLEELTGLKEGSSQ
ncbi:MAG: 30S ribosomal protein S6e [Candidatus Odinarchaeota archaeon]